MRCAERMPLVRSMSWPRSCQWIAKLSSCATTSPPSRISTMRLNSERGSSASLLHLDRHRQHVALAAHRLDDRGLVRVLAQPVPQTAHLHVDAAVERASRRARA